MSRHDTRDEFGERMKLAEINSESYLDITKPILVRIDGKRFSRFTSGYLKPYDHRLMTCMINTAELLLSDTHADIAYTQSDEITLVYLPKTEYKVCKIPFNGRVQKTASVFASKATAYYIREYDFIQRSVETLGDSSPFYIEGAKEFQKDVTPNFDCRIFNATNEAEASNQILWRVHDAMRNAVSCVFRYRIGHKEMQNLDSQKMIDKMKILGIDYLKEYNAFERGGTLIKKSYSKNDSGEITSAVAYLSGVDYREKSFCDRVDYIKPYSVMA